jgi:SEC-C motif-containing protein
MTVVDATASRHNVRMTHSDPCPCGRPLAYAACCGRVHAGEAAADAEALMRSRYSAYVKQLPDYLLASWHPDTRPPTLSLDDADGQRTRWLGLTVHEHTVSDPDHARVRFTARYKVGGGSAVKMLEHSRFVREDGRWYYLDALP